MHPILSVAFIAAALGGPPLADDLFELPDGFHIHRAATAERSRGSYDIVLDSEGRLLVGDGKAIRRLSDRDGDGDFDDGEVIAEGLGPRGPQGLLLAGDHLYAAGGDGIQLFGGYLSGGRLVHRGRLGKPFGTGGDHDAHTLLRGHDGYIYFITGDGGGARERVHITEETSPCLFERAGTVFRFSPDGLRWECIGTGARNSPNLGMNYLGELFSLDSDMEWHVDLPWWRPVRLHHWIAGGDQGWQEVGAYPPYFIDCLPGIHDVGRGSPNWGVFYEHDSLPAKYRDAYLVCDYPSKSATTGGYETAGRLFAFFLERDGAGWKATREVLARPRPGAREGERPVQFALVDIEVAPDGSLLLSDHNQGIWRIFHDRGSPPGRAPSLAPAWPPLPGDREGLLDALLTLPQPSSEWSRKREEEIRGRLGVSAAEELRRVAASGKAPLGRRLRAIRLLAPDAGALPPGFIDLLARDGAPEVRGQAAFLMGLRGTDDEAPLLAALLGDGDPFVRRRAAEAIARNPSPLALEGIIDRLADPIRLVRYAAMTALARYPSKSWFEKAAAREEPQAVLRALIAADLRREPPPNDVVRRISRSLRERLASGASREDRLDLLRILGRFARVLRDGSVADGIARFLLDAFPDPDPEIRWELARLLGEYRVRGAFGELLDALETETEPVSQFHLAQALARIPAGWSPAEERRAVEWFLARQKGWFAEPAGKGLQFPYFWATVLSELGSHHKDALRLEIPRIDLAGQLGGVAVDILAEGPEPGGTLMALYRSTGTPLARRRLLRALGGIAGPAAGAFLREEYLRVPDRETRGVILKGLARRPPEPESRGVLAEGLLHEDADVVRSSVDALSRHDVKGDEAIAARLLAILFRRVELFRPAERLLVSAAGRKRPGYEPDAPSGRRPGDGEIDAGQLFWKAWYGEAFGKEFDPAAAALPGEKEDAEIRAFLVGPDAKGGDPARGRKVYEAARCAGCHGGAGGSAPERLFGPDLAGATRRLTREEMIDAIVDPSKTVADRFKGVLVLTAGGATLTGFITERNEDEIFLADQEKVHRLPIAEVATVLPLEASLMPGGLLARTSWDEIRDLLAFLDQLGASGPTSDAWSGWRGPGGSGVSPEKGLPERWSTTEGLAWTLELPGWGNSSPVIAEGRIYTTTQTPDHDLHVLAISPEKGAVVWDRVVGNGTMKAHELHNMATPTPAADSSGVAVLFGTGDFVSLDLDGNVRWRRNLRADHGEYKILWGMGSSPVLHGDRMYLVCIHGGPSYVLAVDSRTGKDVWKTPRDLPCRAEATDSYSSPLIVEAGGRLELIVAGAEHVTSQDPLTGERIWMSGGLGIDHDFGRTMSSPAASGGVVFACSASVQGLGQMIAVRMGGTGDVTATHRLWEYRKFTPDCPTPIVHEGIAYIVRDDGIGTALDAATGKVLWQKRIGPVNCRSSPVWGDGKVYFLGGEGGCAVFRAGPAGEVIAVNELEDEFIATPAIAAGRIYLKGKRRLWAVGARNGDDL